MSDALATLKAALGPKPGMHRIPLPVESYQHPSLPLSATRLVNMFVEDEPDSSRAPYALLSTPGLVENTGITFGAGPILEMNGDYGAMAYVVSGTHFYRFTAPYNVIHIEDLGDIGTSVTQDYLAIPLLPTIAVGVNAAVVCVPPNAFTCSHTGPLNRITDTFIGASSVTYLDGYFVFTANDSTGQWFTSLLLDPSTYAALDFAFADGVPNYVNRVVTVNNELWFIGNEALEVWYNSGNADFPFRRRAGGVIKYGVASGRTIRVVNDSLFWVTKTGMVMRSIGYKAERVSSQAIEVLIKATGTDALRVFGYTDDGHEFYCLTLGPYTIVYDCNTKRWHNRSSSADGSTAWFPSSAIQLGQNVIFGDSRSGRTFVPDRFGGTEDGIAVIRQATLPPFWAGTNRAFMSRLEIEMEVGRPFGPLTINVDWSDDGGWNFGPVRTLETGTQLETRKRVVTTRLGSFRQRVVRLTSHGRTVLYGVDCDVPIGKS